MRDDIYSNPNSSDDAYREYLALREKSKAETGRGFSVEDTPYGESKYRDRTADEIRRQREVEEYMAAREAAQNDTGHGGRSGGGRRSKKVKKPGKSTMKLKIALVLVAILVIGIGGLAAGGMAYGLHMLDKADRFKVAESDLGIDPAVEDSLSDYRNIAVLGIDARDMTNDDNSRSDAIVIVSINKKNNELRMFSVYRDTLLDVGEDIGLDKITHAYFYGKAERSMRSLNRNMDLNIKEAVVINWRSVATLIDALGGVEINVKESELDELNKYVGETARNVGTEKHKVKKAGKQILDGAQAVTYARIRKDAATGDYRRNERMKIVFKKTIQKAKKADIGTLLNVCKEVMPQIKTNMSSGDMLKLGLKLKSYDIKSTTKGWPFKVTGWTGTAAGGAAWYGPPINLSNNVSELHEKFFDQKDYQPTETVQTISNNISYLTGIY